MNFLRPGVMLLFVHEGKVLVGQRTNVLHPSWQLPQGGRDGEEYISETVIREANEELGLTPEEFDIEKIQSPQTEYIFPEDIQKRDNWYGQRHVWVRCSLKDPSRVFHPSEEFSDFKWVTPQEAIDEVVDFKKECYRQGFFTANLWKGA